MKMFTRDMLLTGPPNEVRSWAVDIARSFEEVTDSEVAVWGCIAGGTVGHYSWTMPIEGLATIAEQSMTALSDQGYLAKIEEGRRFFVGLPKDTIYRPYTTGPAPDSEVGNVAVVTTADAKAGSLGHAVGWGLEIAEYASRITGIDTALLGHAAGHFSRLTWIGIAESPAQADETQDRMTSDEEYLKLIARGGPDFVDGSARTQLFLRIG